MQIVINIPEMVYNGIRNRTEGYGIIECNSKAMANAIYYGIPLPKGHGKLIDADELQKEYPHDTNWDYPVNTNSRVVESIENAPTIVPADGVEKITTNDSRITEIAKEMKTWWSNEGSDVVVQNALDEIIALDSRSE